MPDSMTHEERILAAINLEPYDRVPTAPHINAEFPLRHKGRITADAYDPQLIEEGFQATLDLFDEVGGWDGATLAGHAMPLSPHSMRLRWRRGALSGYKYPGRSNLISNDSSPQFEETMQFKEEDYDTVIKNGWRSFVEKSGEKAGDALFSLDENLAEQAKRLTHYYQQFCTAWKKRGVPVIAGSSMSDPEMMLSLVRSLQPFTLDIFRHPDKVQAALDAMVDDFIDDALESMKVAGPPSPTGIPGMMVACERGSGQYYNLKIFERFVWPYIKKMVMAFHEAGYVTTLHFDTDWTLNLPYLLELPAKSCICELDSTTNIFRAKEILKDHMCIMGDIPPALSSHGTPQEMRDYCTKLIDIVGKGTGFILSTGCAVPPDTRFENFKMMLDTAKSYPAPV